MTNTKLAASKKRDQSIEIGQRRNHTETSMPSKETKYTIAPAHFVTEVALASSNS
jgi:hypothetical protein